MKIIPLIRVKDIEEAVNFYTNVLDFKLKYADAELNVFCVELINGDAELQLSSMDGTPNVVIYVHVDDVDKLFEKYITRGLITPKKVNSPVHESPIDQTWGLREFYVTDQSGNTLRFATPIE